MSIMLNASLSLVASLAIGLEGAPSDPSPLLPSGIAVTQDAQMAPKGRPGGGHKPSRPAGGSHAGGGRPGGGGASRPSHGRPPARGGAHNNINHNNVNVNVNHGGHGGGYDDHYDHHHDHHSDWDDWDDHWHPVRTAATVAVTAAVIGSIVNTVPPSCSTVIVNGISYSQCGSTWYQPQYSGSTVQYVVVNPPR